MVERVYFPINEGLARLAKQMMSFDDYKEGSKTAEYKAYVEKAFYIVDRIAEDRPKELDRAKRVATTYSRRLADNMNRQSRIGTMCPSIMISGGSNFPVRKKEKQNAAMDNAMREWREIDGYIDRLNSILHGKEIIKAGDEDAVMRLEEKISEREAVQELMKEVNAYFKKTGTLDNCPELTAEQIEKLKASQSTSWRKELWRPFESYQLSNNNAEINRLKKRLESLKAIKAEGTTEERYESLGLTVRQNTESVRIQFLFDDKPEASVRDVMKRNGFHWSPSEGAWQRQLNGNGRNAAKRALQELKEQEEKEE